MKDFTTWLKEDYKALDGSVVHAPEGTGSPIVVAGEPVAVGIAPPTGTPTQPTGVAKPTGELAAAYPTIDVPAAIKAIGVELAKPGLQEALESLSPSLKEALMSLTESKESTPLRAGHLKYHEKDFIPAKKTGHDKSTKALEAGSPVHFEYSPHSKTTIAHHVDSEGKHWVNVFDGHPAEHFNF